MEVVGALMADLSFLPQLFQRLQQTDPSDAQWHDLVAFLQVGCGLGVRVTPAGSDAHILDRCQCWTSADMDATAHDSSL